MGGGGWQIGEVWGKARVHISPFIGRMFLFNIPLQLWICYTEHRYSPVMVLFYNNFHCSLSLFHLFSKFDSQFSCVDMIMHCTFTVEYRVASERILQYNFFIGLFLVLLIRDIMVRIRMRIRILGSIPLINGFGCWSGTLVHLNPEHWYI